MCTIGNNRIDKRLNMKLSIMLLSFCILSIGIYSYSEDDLRLSLVEGEYHYDLISKGKENSGTLKIRRKDETKNMVAVRGETKLLEEDYIFSFVFSIENGNIVFYSVNIPTPSPTEEFGKNMLNLVFNGLIPINIEDLKTAKGGVDIRFLVEKYTRVPFNHFKVIKISQEMIMLSIKGRQIRPAKVIKIGEQLRPIDLGQKYAVLFEKIIIYKKNHDRYVLDSVVVNYTSHSVPDYDPYSNFLEEGKYQVKLTRVSNLEKEK